MEKSKQKDIEFYCELRITPDQLEIISPLLFGFAQEELYEYYLNKIHRTLLLSEGRWTNREDQPDFQFLVDLGVHALSLGIELPNNKKPDFSPGLEEKK